LVARLSYPPRTAERRDAPAPTRRGGIRSRRLLLRRVLRRAAEETLEDVLGLALEAVLQRATLQIDRLAGAVGGRLALLLEPGLHLLLQVRPLFDERGRSLAEESILDRLRVDPHARRGGGPGDPEIDHQIALWVGERSGGQRRAGVEL